jgi:glycosyltransferase involved in cell wall biosynthesis
VGRLSIEKGIEELLRAFLLLSAEHADIELVLVGKNMTSWLETFLNQHELQHRVKVTGEINHSELSAFYENASIFVLPSHMEGMPTVMFEAMGVGLPVIISDVGGVSEVIKDGINGLLIKAGDWRDLYLKLKHLLSDEKLRARLGAEARKTVEMNYTWDINAGKMQKIYSTLR